MKKIFTLIGMAMVAMSMNAQTDNTESYLAIDDEGNLNTEFSAAVAGSDDGSTATDINADGNSVVTFGTTNVTVEAVGSATPADTYSDAEKKTWAGQDLTIGASVGDNEYEYTVNSWNAVQWKKGSQGDISFYWVEGTGATPVKAVAEEVINEGDHTGKYRLKYTSFDPEVGGLPVSGLYYKITTKVDGALKVGVWVNKGNQGTFMVDAETKQVSDFLVEGYINGQNWTEDDVTAGLATADQVGKKKWLSNDEIKAIHEAGNQSNPYIIGAGNQPFFGNLVVDAKADKTYYFFTNSRQIGFQGYTFVPGASKEDLTAVEAVKSVASTNANAPMYNLAGQKVSKDFKGFAIQNGRKFMVK